MDHCHQHGWVRGPLCRRCNTAMAYVDRRMMPRAALVAGHVPLGKLLDHASRCPECPRLVPDDIGPTRSLRPTAPMADRPTTVRLRPDISAGVREVADELGITFNAAVSVLLVEALKARGRGPAAKDLPTRDRR
jgi:hypothetical protein